MHILPGILLITPPPPLPPTKKLWVRASIFHSTNRAVHSKTNTRKQLSIKKKGFISFLTLQLKTVKLISIYIIELYFTYRKNI